MLNSTFPRIPSINKKINVIPWANTKYHKSKSPWFLSAVLNTIIQKTFVTIKCIGNVNLNNKLVKYANLLGFVL